MNLDLAFIYSFVFFFLRQGRRNSRGLEFVIEEKKYLSLISRRKATAAMIFAFS